MGSVEDIQSLRMELAKKERELQEQLQLGRELWRENRSLESKIELQEQDWEKVREERTLASSLGYL